MCEGVFRIIRIIKDDYDYFYSDHYDDLSMMAVLVEPTVC